jgi:hypothetical protein
MGLALNVVFLYFPLSVIFAAFVLYLPALAVFPKLILRPLHFSLIPLISYFLAGCLAFSFMFFHAFSHGVVICASIIMLLVAIIRIAQVLEHYSLRENWSADDVRLLIFNFGLTLPLFFLAILSSFAINDALASWNHWAKMYYFSQSIGHSLYPTFYPAFLAYSYQFLGTLNVEGIVKVSLAILTFTIANVLAFSSAKTKEKFWLYLVLVVIVLMPGNPPGLYHFYVTGYADGVLATAVAVSAAVILRYCLIEQTSFNLLLAVLSAVAAAWTKQPGLLWAGLIVPSLLVAKMMQEKSIKLKEILSIIILLGAVFFWVLGTGKNFYHNSGVLQASLHGHSSYWYAFFKGVKEYLILQPTTLALFVLAGMLFNKQKYYALLNMGLWIGLLLWFVFASYELREGLYLIALAGVMIASHDFFAPTLERFSWYQKYFLVNKISNVWLMIYFCAMIAITFLLCAVQVRREGEIFPLNGPKTTIYHLFIDQPAWVYKTLYEDPSTVVAGTSWEDSLFLGKKPILILRDNTPTETFHWLLDNHIQFIMIVPAMSQKQFVTLNDIANRCPKFMQKLALGDTRVGYTVFKLNVAARNTCTL